jgi:acyl-ACP thioesterase
MPDTFGCCQKCLFIYSFETKYPELSTNDRQGSLTNTDCQWIVVMKNRRFPVVISSSLVNLHARVYHHDSYYARYIWLHWTWYIRYYIAWSCVVQTFVVEDVNSCQKCLFIYSFETKYTELSTNNRQGSLTNTDCQWIVVMKNRRFPVVISNWLYSSLKLCLVSIYISIIICSFIVLFPSTLYYLSCDHCSFPSSLVNLHARVYHHDSYYASL